MSARPVIKLEVLSKTEGNLVLAITYAVVIVASVLGVFEDRLRYDSLDRNGQPCRVPDRVEFDRWPEHSADIEFQACTERHGENSSWSDRVTFDALNLYFSLDATVDRMTPQLANVSVDDTFNARVQLYGFQRTHNGTSPVAQLIYDAPLVLNLRCIQGHLVCRPVQILSEQNYEYDLVHEYGSFITNVTYDDYDLTRHGAVTYAYAYHNRAFKVFEMALHGTLLFVFMVALFYWLRRVTEKPWADVLREQVWMTILLVCIVLYSNPFFIPLTLDQVRLLWLLSGSAEMLAVAAMMLFWLLLVSGATITEPRNEVLKADDATRKRGSEAAAGGSGYQALGDNGGAEEEEDDVGAGVVAGVGAAGAKRDSPQPEPVKLDGLAAANGAASPRSSASGSSAGSRRSRAAPSSSGYGTMVEIPSPVALDGDGGGDSGARCRGGANARPNPNRRGSLRDSARRPLLVRQFTDRGPMQGETPRGFYVWKVALLTVFLGCTQALVFMQDSVVWSSSSETDLSGPHTTNYLASVVLLGVAGLVMLVWIVWFAVAVRRASRHLRRLPYVSTRFRQLSFRFFVIQSLGVVFYFIVFVIVRVVNRSVYIGIYRESIATFVLLSVYVLLLAFIYLPATAAEAAQAQRRRKTTGLLRGVGTLLQLPFKVLGASFSSAATGSADARLADFAAERAYLLSFFSLQVYFDLPGSPPSTSTFGEADIVSGQFGFELVRALNPDPALDCHCMVLRRGHTVVVAFRGTVSRANLQLDFQFTRVPLPLATRRGFFVGLASDISHLDIESPYVHRGFWAAYEALRGEILEAVREARMAAGGPVRVLTTGHSLGGPLACFCAYELATEHTIDVECYTYGAPRCGNGSFAHLYNAAVPNTYRVCNDRDIVTTIPKIICMYKHVGTEVIIDRRGNFILDPLPIEKMFRGGRRSLEDHRMLHYMTGLRLACESLGLGAGFRFPPEELFASGARDDDHGAVSVARAIADRAEAEDAADTPGGLWV